VALKNAKFSGRKPGPAGKGGALYGSFCSASRKGACTFVHATECAANALATVRRSSSMMSKLDEDLFRVAHLDEVAQRSRQWIETAASLHGE